MSLRNIDDLAPAPYNPREISDAAAKGLRASLDKYGDIAGIVWNKRTRRLVTGHQRVAQLRALGAKFYDDGDGGIPELALGDRAWRVRVVDWSEEEEKAANVTANNPHIGGNFTEELDALLGELHESMGAEAFGELRLDELSPPPASPYEQGAGEGAGSLAAKFGAPPVSLLDARQGYWRERKAAWFSLGLDTSAGRESMTNTVAEPVAGTSSPIERGRMATGGSSFDPVLAELMMGWFCPPGGTVLDPFAGESTKGIVAARMGFGYHGIELRPEQVAANAAQAERVLGARPHPRWFVGDSAELGGMEIQPSAMVLTSPPYFDLEVYSGDKSDGSVFSDYRTFVDWLCSIMASAAERIGENGFVVVKIGDVRDKRGAYRGLVSDYDVGMRARGLVLYNRMAYVTPFGNAQLRAGCHFKGGRKLENVWQTVLVHLKGDAKRVKEWANWDVNIADIAEQEEE